jgi:hypothetical protein
MIKLSLPTAGGSLQNSPTTAATTDGNAAAYQGVLTAYAGDWERGCALAERARNLNPHHPGWYRFASAFDAYRKSEYRDALDAALKINMPRFWRANLALAVAHGQLGEREAAGTAPAAVAHAEARIRSIRARGAWGSLGIRNSSST